MSIFAGIVHSSELYDRLSWKQFNYTKPKWVKFKVIFSILQKLHLVQYLHLNDAVWY